MPFAGYKDFADCVAQNKDKADPNAYCGQIQHEVEGKSDEGDALTDLPDAAREAWLKSFQEHLTKTDAPSASKIAWASVYRRWERGPSGWMPLKVFVPDVKFKTIFKSDRVIFGAASVAIKDADNDLFTESALRSAFNSYIERGHVLFYHKNIPIGEVLPAYDAPSGEHLVSEVKDGKMNVVVRIYKDTQIANDVWKGIEDGTLRAFSIGGQTIGESVKVCENEDCSQYHKRIDKLDLHEISIVPNPANEASYFTIVKSKVEEKKMTEEQKEKPCDGCGDKDIPAIVAAAVKILEARKAEHPMECPEGHEMKDGKCVPTIEEKKSESNDKEKTTMADEPKTEPKPTEKAPEPNPLETRIAALEGSLGDIKSMLAKALEPKPAPVEEKKTEAPVPAVREKVSVPTDAPAESNLLNEPIKTDLGQTATWANVFAKASAWKGV